MKVPFVDLKLQYQTYKTEIDKAISDVISETAFIGGSGNKYVQQFEYEFAAYLGLKNVITCANGTDSLEILLEAYGIGDGDEVIVPALSWISSSEAVGRSGAKPVFVDICEDTLLLNPDLIETKINKNTKAIMPVHLYGNPVNMEPIMQLAAKHNLIVIEDCAQSHGAMINGKLSGTFGHASSFSFYPGKNLGAYGDAGAIATNDDHIAAKCRMIANHGQLKKHNHIMEGRNSRMDGIQAAVLNVKLNYLKFWNEKRNQCARYYLSNLDSNKIKLPVITNNSYHVFHLFVIQVNSRENFKQFLQEHEIETAIHYPMPLPFLNPYSRFNHVIDDFPIAYNISKNIISLPIYPELSFDKINYVVNTVNSYLK